MKKTLPLIGVLLVTIGAGGLWTQYRGAEAQPIQPVQQQALETHQPTVASSVSSTPISGHPVRIRVPRLAVDLAVIDGVYNWHSRTWNLADNKAQFAVMTAEPNSTSGNTFIYGHNSPLVFAPLLHAEAGDEVIIETSNGHQFTYVLQSSRNTVPTDDSLFRYQGPPILTLQTCSGSNFQYRYLLTFALKEAH